MNSPAQIRPDFEPGRLWSLWDIMINFKISNLCMVLDELSKLHTDYAMRVLHVDAELKSGGNYANLNARNIPHEVTDKDKADILARLQLYESEVRELELWPILNRVDGFRQQLYSAGVTIHIVVNEIRILREMLESDLHFKFFYRYPQAKVQILRNATSDWGVVFSKFEKMKPDIIAAIDCYALGHNTASVFYFMRIMELAVQAFGKKLGVSIVKINPGKKVSELTWECILNELNPKIKQLKQDTVAKKRKYERLAAVQAHLYSVKDAWRNPTMHPRVRGYNDLEALNIMNHVRSFMIGFSDVV